MKNSNRFWLVVLMITCAAFCRLITNYVSYHDILWLWNFTPIAAMGLFAGAKFNDKKFAIAVPIITLFPTDIILGLHSGVFAVYGSMVLITLIGFWLKKRESVLNIIGASLASSVLFFAITNFFVWFGNPNFTQNISGLLNCYTVAIPFFGNTISGDLFFCIVLFGSFSLLKNRIPALAGGRK